MAQLLQCPVPRLFNDRPNPVFAKRGAYNIVNWGNANIGVGVLQHKVHHLINDWHAVSVAGNKLLTFNKLKDVDGIRIPAFTTDRLVATEWLKSGSMVVCRHHLRGHSGSGIALVDPHDSEDKTLPEAPLYVQYIKKAKEFRVHVAFGGVIDVQEKRKRSDLPDGFERDFQVRNHHTGWVYCRESIDEPEGLRSMAVDTVQTLGLDFGAVDIIFNRKGNSLYVLEVNTAPGLEGTTVDKYAEAFVHEIQSKAKA